MHHEFIFYNHNCIINMVCDDQTMTIKTIKGVCSELIAAKEFLNKGYYVAKSLDPQCPFDLIVVDKQGKTRLLDVKSVSYRKSQSYNCKPGDTINRSISKKQKSLGVEIYYVDGNQKFYYWNDYIILHYQSIYMNKKMLRSVGVDLHKDKDALKQIGWHKERKKMLKCIKGKPLSIQKIILKAYEERYVMRDEYLH